MNVLFFIWNNLRLFDHKSKIKKPLTFYSMIISSGKTQIKLVIKYIERHEEHHRKYSFIDEYRKLLKLFDIEYDEKFIFKPVHY